MNFSDTYFGFLQADCLAEFGEEKGDAIYRETETLFQSFLASADYRDNDSIRKHMQKNIFPVMAYYLVLQENGYAKEKAYEMTLKETQKMAAMGREQNKKMTKLPFTYQIFKMFCKKVMKKAYPPVGWETEWIRFDGQEIHLDLKTCLYVDVTTQHGCPELCTVFCKNDTTSFEGLAPKIRFERQSTLAEGGKYCDFHFIKEKNR